MPRQTIRITKVRKGRRGYVQASIFGNMLPNRQSRKSSASCSRHTKRKKIVIAAWQTIMMILIFPADNSAFFHFLVNCLSSRPVLVGLPPSLVFALQFLLNLTFVSKKMVDMQNVAQLTPLALVIMTVWEMRYKECLLRYNR